MQQMRLESLLVNGKKFLLNSVIHLDAQFNQLKCLCAQHLPTHLVRLNVDNNRLMSLDLSACEDLTYISARRNQLEELTSSHIPLSASCILMEDNYFNKVQLIDACPSLLTLTVNLYLYNSCLDLSGASRLTRLSLVRTLIDKSDSHFTCKSPLVENGLPASCFDYHDGCHQCTPASTIS